MLRALYSYFMDKPLREVPHIDVSSARMDMHALQCDVLAGGLFPMQLSNAVSVCQAGTQQSSTCFEIEELECMSMNSS